jgi:hypothetical protein
MSGAQVPEWQTCYWAVKSGEFEGVRGISAEIPRCTPYLYRIARYGLFALHCKRGLVLLH